MNYCAGIYEILNTMNEKCYIGSSVNLHRRWKQHRAMLTANCHSNSHLQRAWNTYGEKAFTFSIVEYGPANDWLLEAEQYWIEKRNAATGGYNILPVAGSSRGFQYSDEARQKMSKAKKGENNPLFGKAPSEETRQKMSEAKIGKAPSEETRQKMAAAQKGNTNGAGNKGKTHSAETRQKMAAAKKGKPKTAEHRANMSKANKGKPWSAKRREAQQKRNENV